MEGPELLAPPLGPDPDPGDSDGLWLPCGDVSESSGVAARGEYCNLETLVLFKRYGGGGGGDGDGDDEESHARLVVNQTWYCDDVSPEYPCVLPMLLFLASVLLTRHFYSGFPSEGPLTQSSRTSLASLLVSWYLS